MQHLHAAQVLLRRRTAEAGPRRLHDSGHRMHRLQEDAVRGCEGRPGADPRARRSCARRRDPGARRGRGAQGGGGDDGARPCPAGSGGRGDFMRCTAAALLVSLLVGAGCSGRDDPEAAVEALIAAARAGDRAAVYARFGPRTRARIDGLLASAQRTGGTRTLRPEDLVTVGWLPPAWEPAGTRLLRRDGAEAEVEVYSASGERQALKTVQEGKTWKVELPFR